jgi:hypothetical protein
MTFSVGTKGAIVGNEFPNNLTTTRGVVLPDSVTSNLGTQSSAITQGIHACMRLGQQVLVQMPDGSQRWCTFAEGSTGAYPKLLPVGP